MRPGGVVAFGESVSDSAKRELEEEMGIRGVPLKFEFDHAFVDGVVSPCLSVVLQTLRSQYGSVV